VEKDGPNSHRASIKRKREAGKGHEKALAWDQGGKDTHSMRMCDMWCRALVSLSRSEGGFVRRKTQPEKDLEDLHKAYCKSGRRCSVCGKRPTIKKSLTVRRQK